MNKIIVVVGPTASNKSNLSIHLAKKFNLPVINADAFQTYKEINVGTNKLDRNIIDTTPIHLMDNVSIYDEWNIVRFQREAMKLIDYYHKKNIIPIVVGGSHLYVDCLIKNYNLTSKLKRDSKYDEYSNQQLFDIVSKLDKQVAEKITVGNRKRLTRAIQLLENNQSMVDNNPIYNPIIINCQMERSVLYEKISDSVDKMIVNGWQKEVLDLLNTDPNVMNLSALKAIGYNEVFESIVSKTNINIDLIKQKSRRYAKRQITWCNNKFSNAIVFNQYNVEEILIKVDDWIKND